MFTDVGKCSQFIGKQNLQNLSNSQWNPRLTNPFPTHVSQPIERSAFNAEKQRSLFTRCNVLNRKGTAQIPDGMLSHFRHSLPAQIWLEMLRCNSPSQSMLLHMPRSPMGKAKIYSVTILLWTRAQTGLVSPTPAHLLPHPCPSEVGLKEPDIHIQCVAISMGIQISGEWNYGQHLYSSLKACFFFLLFFIFYIARVYCSCNQGETP